LPGRVRTGPVDAADSGEPHGSDFMLRRLCRNVQREP
jgi:hypothetical protein